MATQTKVKAITMKRKSFLIFIPVMRFAIYSVLLLACKQTQTPSTVPLPFAVIYSPTNVLSATSTALSADILPSLPSFDIGDGGFLSEKPCGPPCFMGIIPGQTKKDEVIQFLR